MWDIHHKIKKRLILVLLVSITFLFFPPLAQSQVSTNVSDPDVEIRIVPSHIEAEFNDYRFLAECRNFVIENNNNKIGIDAKDFSISRLFDDNPIIFSMQSDNELNIDKINVINKSDGTSLDEFTNVSNLSISTSQLTLDSNDIETSYFITEKVSSVGNHVNFYGMTKAEIRLPDNDFNLTFGILHSSQIYVDENLIDIPGDKELYVHFRSSDEKAIFFDRELKISAFSWNSLFAYRQDEPIKLTAQGCDGTLSIAEPLFDFDLHGSETITIETTLGCNQLSCVGLLKPIRSTSSSIFPIRYEISFSFFFMSSCSDTVAQYRG